MSPITILENEHVTLLYHPETKIVHHTFHKTVRGQIFRDTLNAGLEVFQQYGVHKWLSDDRSNTALPDDDTEWAKTVWFPKVLAAGWQYWALVWPASTMAVVNLQEFVDTYRPFGLRVMVFKDPQKAMYWLEQNKSTVRTKTIPTS